MKYFLIAGEPSGDMHGASLMKEIKNSDTEAEFMFFGGDLMKDQGGTMVKHYHDMAFMGILPVILNLGKISENFDICKKNLLSFTPNILILIDYPGFNLQMAKFAKENGIKTAYYISPKIWASRTHRVKKIKAYVDQLYTIFPFETEFYKKYNYSVSYVGNPVYDVIKKELSKPINFDSFCTKNQLTGKPIIAILAGSRKTEISELLPIMEQIPHYFPDFQFVIAGAPGNTIDFYQSILKSEIPVIFDQTYELLRHSKAAIVTSGTATLETALLNIPQVVCYKMGMGWFLELFRNQILKTNYFSLVNLVGEKEVVKELFQSQVTVKNIKAELIQIIGNEEYRNSILKDYSEIAQQLASNGAASVAANQIVQSIKK
jgi:lipid-A-disaccharide synthase